jgi:hypothetical protein
MADPDAVPPVLSPLRNDDSIVEHFADTLVGINFINGNVNPTSATVRANHAVEPAEYYRQVTARLVIPLACATEVQKQIAQIIAVLQSGLMNQEAAGSPKH